jgi:ubiquinone/menaquinone biosynthesis C-methylase UbiE
MFLEKWDNTNMTPNLRKLLFETLYRNRYLYRFASTVPFAGQWRVWQRLVLSRITGRDVLELGCGLGDLFVDMLQAGYNCRAIEHSPQMVAAARDNVQKDRTGQASWIMQGEAQHLPFSDDSFDTVVSTFPSEYIYDPDTIAEVARVLRPSGRVLIIEGSNLLPVGFVQSLLVLLQTFVYGRAALFGPRERRTLQEEIARSRSTENADVVTEILPDAWFGHLIPLEKSGLQRRAERIRSPRWEVYMTIGEKPR